ncbi:hypothetical protein IQ244_27740 [Nostoc sp. LEGE 06077]|nr:hypothetical protein [Nostoc sp. LEGE 06077]
MSAAETALGKAGKCRFGLSFSLVVFLSVFSVALLPLTAGSSASIMGA